MNFFSVLVSFPTSRGGSGGASGFITNAAGSPILTNAGLLISNGNGGKGGDAKTSPGCEPVAKDCPATVEILFECTINAPDPTVCIASGQTDPGGQQHGTSQGPDGFRNPKQATNGTEYSPATIHGFDAAHSEYENGLNATGAADAQGGDGGNSLQKGGAGGSANATGGRGGNGAIGQTGGNGALYDGDNGQCYGAGAPCDPMDEWGHGGKGGPGGHGGNGQLATSEGGKGGDSLLSCPGDGGHATANKGRAGYGGQGGTGGKGTRNGEPDTADDHGDPGAAGTNGWPGRAGDAVPTGGQPGIASNCSANPGGATAGEAPDPQQQPPGNPGQWTEYDDAE